MFGVATHLVYSAGRDDVRHVWVRGQQVVRDGALTRTDLAALLAQVQTMRTEIQATISS